MDPLYKKRNRVPALCLVCRRRKNRCDRVRPVCGTCKKKSISHLCFYESGKPPNEDRHFEDDQVAAPPHHLHGGPPFNANGPSGPNGPMGSFPGPKGPAPYANHTPGPHRQEHSMSPGFHGFAGPLGHGPVQGIPAGVHQGMGAVGEGGEAQGQSYPVGGHGQPQPSPSHSHPSQQAYQHSTHHAHAIPQSINSRLSSHSSHLVSSPLNPHSSTQNPGHGQLKLSLPSPGLFPRQHLPPPARYPMPYREAGFREYSAPSLVGSQGMGAPPVSSGSVSSQTVPPRAPAVAGSLAGSSPEVPGPNGEPMAGSDPGSVGGSVQGSAHGSVRGSVSGSVTGSTAGSLLGSGSGPIVPPPVHSELPPLGLNVRNESLSSKLGLLPYERPPANTGNTPGTSPESRTSLVHKVSPAKSQVSPSQPVQLAPLQDGLVGVPVGTSAVLRVDPNDVMDVFSNALFSLMVEGSNWSQQGPLLYIGLVKSDPFMKLIRHYTITLFMLGELSQFIHKDRIKRRVSANKRHKSSLVDGLKSEAASKDTSTDGLPASQAGDDDPHNTDALIVTKIGGSDDQEDLGSTSPPLFPLLLRLGRLKRDYYATVEQAALEILPPKNVTLMLFFQFVGYVQPFVPVISETSVLLDVRQVMPGFPEFKEERITALLVRSDHGLHVLGVFLLVLRLGYMSLVHTSDVQYSKDEMAMVAHMRAVSNRRYMAVVGTCVSDSLASPLYRCSIKELQCLSLLYFYRQVAPDDGHGLGGADSAVLLGTIIRQAVSIGLNRDPSAYTDHDNIRSQTALVSDWRHLWSFLCDSDAVSAMSCGSVPNLALLDFSDVRLPEVENRLGQATVVMTRLKEICAIYRQICNMLTNVQRLPKVADILLKANELEQIFVSFFGPDFFNEYICAPASSGTAPRGIGLTQYELSYLKVIKFNTFIQLRNNLSCLYYKVAIHYEQQHDKGTPGMVAAIELFKIFVKSVVQLVYITSYTLDHLVELFGRGYDFVLTASNERCMIKTHNFISSFFIRLIHHKRQLDVRCRRANQLGVPDIEAARRAQVVDSLFQMIIVEAELFIGNFRKLSRTYINSYRLYVMTYLVLKQCLDDVEVFFERTADDSLDDLYHSGANMLEHFTYDELVHLRNLCEDFRVAKHKNEEQRRKRDLDDDAGHQFTVGTVPVGGASTISDSPDDPLSGMNMQELATDMMTNDDIVRLFDMYGDVDRPAWSDL